MSVEREVMVIGAGPAGLTAGIYLARAGLKPLILEKLVPGGQAATTDVVENYPGFDDPVGGLALAETMRRQAEKFGAERGRWPPTRPGSSWRGAHRSRLERNDGRARLAAGAG
jgi:thioredoxin reductase